MSIAAGAALGGPAAGGKPGVRPRAARLPPPEFGRSLDIGLVSGTVLITPPAGHTFKLGAQDRNIPIGSVIDTVHGRVDLRAAPVPGGKAGAARVEDAQFYDGKFSARQPKGATVTSVVLKGGSFASCTAHSSGASASRSLPHRVVRLLRASGPGRFRTQGRYAAGTVLGTVWLTEDYCDGTLFTVQRGIVSVVNLVTHATVRVTAGHSYFARAG